MKKNWGFAEALGRGIFRKDKMKHPSYYRVVYFSFQLPDALSAPFSFSFSFTPKKRGRENCLGYFRFLIMAKLARPKTAAIETAPIIAASVLINGAGVSGVIGPLGDTAGSTVRYVIACEP